MWRFAGVVIPFFLTACNAWIRPNPLPAQRRLDDAQAASVVSIESYCDPFGDGTMAEGRAGTGVMVSDWQVLTAAHIVDCAGIPIVHVTTITGQTWRMSFQKEWTSTNFFAKHDGIVRLQLSSADSLVPALPPPTIRTWPGALSWEEVLWVGTVRGRVMAFATGQDDDLVFYDSSTHRGDSGSPSFDADGNIISIHLGSSGTGHAYGMAVTQEMLP